MARIMLLGKTVEALHLLRQPECPIPKDARTLLMLIDGQRHNHELKHLASANGVESFGDSLACLRKAGLIQELPEMDDGSVTIDEVDSGLPDSNLITLDFAVPPGFLDKIDKRPPAVPAPNAALTPPPEPAPQPPRESTPASPVAATAPASAPDEATEQILQAKRERAIREKLLEHLRPRIEEELRARLTEQLRPIIEEDLRAKLLPELRTQIVRELTIKLEAALRPQVEKRLQTRLEAELRPRIEQELRATLAGASVRPNSPAPA